MFWQHQVEVNDAEHQAPVGDVEENQKENSINEEENVPDEKKVEYENPFDCDPEGENRVEIRTENDGKVLVSYPMLVYISDEFENLIQTDDGSEPGEDGAGEIERKKRFIDAKEFTSKCVIKAISFYFPRFYDNQIKGRIYFRSFLSSKSNALLR